MKIIKILLIIFAVSIVVFLGRNLFVSADKATKTYKNGDLGFQFKYKESSEFYYQGDSAADGGIFLLTLKDESLSKGKKYKDDELYFDLEVVELGTNWVNTDNCVVVETEKTPVGIFNDQQMTKVQSHDGAYNRHNLNYCVIREGKVYLFSSGYSLDSGNKNVIEKLYTDILTSFEFI